MINPVGTAPGFRLTIGQCRFFFLPGVPFEMRRMLEDHFIPQIIKLQGAKRQFYLSKTISGFRLTESITGERPADLSAAFPEIQLGLRAKFPEIQVKLYTNGLAEGVRQVGGATFGLATTGIAGPSGATSEKPVGTVCIGLATPRETIAQRFHFNYQDCLMNEKMFAMTALDLLRRELLRVERGD